MKTLQKIIILFLAVALFLPLNIKAQSTGQDKTHPKQNNQERREKVKAMKIAYITGSVDLTPAEADKFWPLYNEYQAKREELNKAYREKMKANRDVKPENLTEQQAEAMIDATLDNDQKQLDLKKEYAVKFKAILGARKLVALYKAEKEFNKLLLDKLKDSK